MKSIIDYLIIGQGLAGSCFALKALLRNRSVTVVDQAEKNISSQVAAGLYNPITGRKWVKTWMADEIFPAAINFYQQMENELKGNILDKTPIYRPFPDIESQNEWIGKSTTVGYSKYISRLSPGNEFHCISDPLGGVILNYSGRLKVSDFLRTSSDYLIKHCTNYLNEQFKDEDLRDHGEYFEYRDNHYRMIIYAEGPQVTENKLWKQLPFRVVKGELLEIETKEKFPHQIIPNKGVWMIPLNDGYSFKVGATYDNRDLSIEPTQAARSQLVKRLENLYTGDFVIKSQAAGLRPATKDRRPILGRHPENQKIIIFNGLGTKGVTLAPYFAEHLLDHLENQQELIKEVDIKRFL